MNREQETSEFKNINDETPPNPEEIRIDSKDRKWRWTDTGYTVRQYYAHVTPEKGPGPGWDTRTILLEDEHSKKRFGRTFSRREVFQHRGADELPDTPYFGWKLFVEGE